jgi:saccharopine dehydrogenase-like NADP-dependent oxidoreductase
MKVFVLGGSGKVGMEAIRLLAQSELVSEIVVAGRSLERAGQVATATAKKAGAVAVDGSEEEGLRSLVAGCDIVVNAAYNPTVVPAIRAAMHNGAHYCDVSWGGVLPEALQLAAEAETAGITSIVANGVSPCISNLMGVHVARQLEEVEQLQVWRAEIMNFQSGRELRPRQWLEDPQESLAALQEFRGFIAMTLQRLQKDGRQSVRVYRDGRWVDSDPISEGLDVPLPGGGSTILYPYFSGHDFWGMLPRDLAVASPAEMWFSPFPPQLHDLLREQALRVLAGETEAETAVNLLYDTVEQDPHRWLTLADAFVPISHMWVGAVGRQGGRSARSSCWVAPEVWYLGGYPLTSVALVAAALKVMRGETRRPGVWTAEKAFEPQSFFDEVASLIPGVLPDGKLTGERFEWLE